MNFEPSDAPVMKLGSVDVIDIDRKEKSIGLIVHIFCWDHELQSPENQSKAQEGVKGAIKYLIMEGFIPNAKGWDVGVAVVGHPPKE
jgi:hypothetical protein